MKRGGIISVCLANDITTNGMIDTGSDVSLVSKGIINRLAKKNLVATSNAKLSGANGLPVEVLGEINMGFQMEGCYFQSMFLVVENFSHGMLLGKDFFVKQRCSCGFSSR